jgi:hypothetical protein
MSWVHTGHATVLIPGEDLLNSNRIQCKPIANGKDDAN